MNKNLIFEQYKIAIDTADKTTDRRYSFNKFMITICTALIAGICTIFPHCPYCTIPITLIGIIICGAWIKQINCFKTMVKIKYNSVKRIEKKYKNILKTYCCEYKQREQAKNNSSFNSFSEQEKIVANAFKIGFILYLFYVLLLLIIDKIYIILCFIFHFLILCRLLY